FTPGTLQDGLGAKSGRIWDASPAKPSKPLQIDAKSGVLPLGVRAEFLAGLSPDSQFTFQRSVRSLKLSARLASDVENRARVCESAGFRVCFTNHEMTWTDAPKEGRLCRHFRNWSDWDAKEFARRRNRLRWRAVLRSAVYAFACTRRRPRSRTPHCAKL